MTTINVLVPFNLLVDTDMGLIKLIQFEYHNTTFFYEGLLNATIEEQQFLLIRRTNPNPLSVILQEDVRGEADNLYNQFMEKEYDKIIKLSTNTSIANLAVLLRVTKDQVVRITVLCSCEEEIKLLRARGIHQNKTIIGKPEDISINDYDTIYLKNIQDIRLYRNVYKKSIYVANYGFNITMVPDEPDPLLPKDIIREFGVYNEFRVFTIYRFDPKKIPVE